jgi:hypothetical protein
MRHIYQPGRNTTWQVQNKMKQIGKTPRSPVAPKQPREKLLFLRTPPATACRQQKPLFPMTTGSSSPDFHRRLSNELKPVGGVEELLVDRIVSSAWRRGRLMRIEVSISLARLRASSKRRKRKTHGCFLSISVRSHRAREGGESEARSIRRRSESGPHARP